MKIFLVAPMSYPTFALRPVFQLVLETDRKNEDVAASELTALAHPVCLAQAVSRSRKSCRLANPNSLYSSTKKEPMVSQRSTKVSWLKAIGIGIAVSVLTAIVMVALFKTGVSPFPKPPSLAFAETLLGRSLPMPVGLLFHTLYVTFWSVVFVRYLPRKNLLTALGLAALLWIIILVVFFPLLGWGFAGLAISPMLIPGSALSHILFGILLWALDRYFGK